MSDVMEPTTALAVIPAASLPTIIAADSDGILSAIAAKVNTFKPDASTPAGRDEMRSLAYDVAKSKTALVKIGKGLTETWRKSTAAVNAECKIIEDRMDALRDQVRAPLTAWENVEKDRVAGHEKALAAICETWNYGQTETAAEFQGRLDYLRNPPTRDWQEFAQRAAAAYASEIARTEVLLAAAEKREAEAAELARLRAAEAERAAAEAVRIQAERERQIAAKAAEDARVAAEVEAARAIAEERTKAAREAEAAQRALEVERQRAEQAEADRKAAAEAADRRAAQAEAARMAAIEKAERDRETLAAKVEEDRIAAEVKAKADRDAAVAAEQKRVADALAVERAAAEKRAANEAHKRRINQAALAAIVEAGATPEIAKAIVLAIYKGSIPHVSISY